MLCHVRSVNTLASDRPKATAKKSEFFTEKVFSEPAPSLAIPDAHRQDMLNFLSLQDAYRKAGLEPPTRIMWERRDPFDWRWQEIAKGTILPQRGEGLALREELEGLVAKCSC